MPCNHESAATYDRHSGDQHVQWCPTCGAFRRQPNRPHAPWSLWTAPVQGAITFESLAALPPDEALVFLHAQRDLITLAIAALERQARDIDPLFDNYGELDDGG